MFVQRSEFNFGERIALYKNYLLLLFINNKVEPINSKRLVHLRLDTECLDVLRVYVMCL